MDKKSTHRDRQKRETRRHIQVVARRLIAEHGYEKTTMRLLAREAGVGLGTIGLHFRDKRSLLLASFLGDIGDAVVNAIRSVPEDGPFREQFRHILERMYGYYGSDTGYLRTMAKEALFARGEWGAAFGEQTRQCVAMVAQLLEDAQDRGEVRPEVDCARVAEIFWPIYLHGLIDGFSKECFVPEDQTAMVMRMGDVILDGIMEKGS